MLAVMSALLGPVSLLAQTAAPAAAAPAARGGGRGGGAAATVQVQGASPAQQTAITAMEQEFAPLVQTLTTARAGLLSASFAEPRNDGDLRAKVNELQTAEQALAAARAAAFVKLQGSEASLNAAQVQSLVVAQLGGGAPAGGAAGGRGGRGGGAANNPNRLAGEAAPQPTTSLQTRVRQLDAILGSTTALEEAKKIAMDPSASLEARKLALQTIANRRDAAARPMAEQLLKVRGLNAVAAGALATIDSPEIGSMLVAAYPDFAAEDRPQLIAALVARRSTAKTLLDALADQKIPRAEVSAVAASQIATFSDDALNQQLTKVWGNLRASDAEKVQLLARVKAELTPANLANANKSAGRVVFNSACAACHTIFGTGGNVGPDLTSSARGNLDYVLSSVVDPSAVVAKDFTVTTANLKNEQSISGVIASEDARVLSLKTTTGIVTVQKADIATRTQSELSMMPDGLFQSLAQQQIRNLVSYLVSPEQVPLPTP